MPDSKSFPSRSPKDSDDHSDKAAGKKPQPPLGNDDRRPENTVVLPEDTQKSSSNQNDTNKAGEPVQTDKTVVLDLHDAAPPSSKSDDPMQTMIIGENEDLRDLIANKPKEEEKQAKKTDQKKTISLDPNPPESRRDDPMQTMVIGENQSLRDLIADEPKEEEKKQPNQNKTLSLDPNPPASRGDDPMQTMVIGENQDIRDLVGDKPKEQEKKQPSPKKTLSLDPNPPARNDDPMQTMVIGNNDDLRNLVSKPKDSEQANKSSDRPKTVSLDPNAESGGSRKSDPNQTMMIGDDTNLRDLFSDKPEGKDPSSPKTLSLDRDPPTSADSADPNQTMSIGDGEDVRSLFSGATKPDQPSHQKTGPLDNNPPPSRSKPSHGDTLSLDKSKSSAPSKGLPPKQDATATTVLGQNSTQGTPPPDPGSRTMPLTTGSAPPQSGSSSRDSSGTMVLGKDDPPQQDPRSKTVVLGGQAPENRTMPLDGSPPASRPGATQTTVLGDKRGDDGTKTVSLGQGQPGREQEPGHQTVPLGEFGSQFEATQRSATEPLRPSQLNTSEPPYGSQRPDSVEQPNRELRTTQSKPIRASSFAESPRAGETRQAQLIRRTTSALAFAALAILISILCATLSATAISVTYSCSVLALLVGVFSFWRYTRLLRQLGPGNASAL